MTGPGDDAGADAGAEEVARELRRSTDRLRTLPLARLDDPAPPWPSRTAAARAAAQVLADLAQDLEEGAGATRRALPVLAPAASGDVLAVTGHDLLRAAAADPAAAAGALRAAHAALVRLRRAL
ncbi:hypothetical protein [Vallicoccus soli]|uniref:Uncharacterized protein n=1 Tax=Vallicoccus soli TaxID=2339232 RepID=A0A3A3ZMN1_9ACTN|nr:hypothetical protein [Vallicoccus soli]RJK97931.1 hypothetical protein D5H78_02910 [Vallicoccus soli]